MNSVLTESLYFLKSNLKPISLFIFPFALFSIITASIGIYDPKSSAKNFLFFVHIIFISPIYLGGIFILIKKLANNEKTSFLPIIQKAMRLWVPLLLVTLISGLIIGGGLVLLIIPGIWLFLRLMLSPLYVVFENLPATQAIGEAYKDSSPHLQEFFYALLPFLALFIISMIIRFNVPLIGNNFSTIVEAIVAEFIFVLISIVQYRLYILFIKRPNN